MINVDVWALFHTLATYILLLSGGKLGYLSIFFLTALMIFFSTLVIGGAGSVMLELYGWESVFYISGILAVLWAYSMWKCMLKGEGNCNTMLVSLKELVWACVTFWHPGFFSCSLFQTTGNSISRLMAVRLNACGGELRSSISPHLCATQYLKRRANIYTLCLWGGKVNTAASVHTFISVL